LGLLFPIYGKVKNVPSHQPVIWLLPPIKSTHYSNINFWEKHTSPSLPNVAQTCGFAWTNVKIGYPIPSTSLKCPFLTFPILRIAITGDWSSFSDRSKYHFRLISYSIYIYISIPSKQNN
jgi:hypothetical protein